MNRTRDRGNWAESFACKFLQDNGLRLISKNFSCRSGEIDIIMSDDDTLVFVEVRYRKNARFGGGIASVDERKQSRLIRSAETYLQKNHAVAERCRFDVVSIEAGSNEPEVTWIRNAFQA